MDKPQNNLLVAFCNGNAIKKKKLLQSVLAYYTFICKVLVTVIIFSQRL